MQAENEKSNRRKRRQNKGNLKIEECEVSMNFEKIWMKNPPDWSKKRRKTGSELGEKSEKSGDKKGQREKGKEKEKTRAGEKG